MLSQQALKDLIAYTGWASARLVEAASQLPSDQLTRDFGTADKSVLGTLVHTFGADRLWMQRVGGEPNFFLSEADYQLSVLQSDWPAIHRKWGNWVGSLTDASAAAEIAYSDMRG